MVSVNKGLLVNGGVTTKTVVALLLPLWGSCRGATEGASPADTELPPPGPLGHLPRRGGDYGTAISNGVAGRPVAP
jgi:hypothetical protein